MIEHLKEIQNWTESGSNVVLARVVQTWGSSPRPVGSLMLVSSEGKIAGSVSGGCVEGAVAKAAENVMESRESRNLTFGVSDEDAWSVGLSCGGSIQVFLENYTNEEVWKTLVEDQEENKSCIFISSLEDGNNTHTLIRENGKIIGDSIPENVISEARESYQQRSHRVVSTKEKSYFIQLFPRKSILLIIGVAHITVDLVSLGNMYGFETVVIDPRGFFAKNTVFKDPPSKILEAYPSEVLDEFPLDAYTFCAILSHDPKIDDNALEVLLPSNVGYIGALGSKKTHQKRTNRLLEKGFVQSQIDKIHAPIGVSINAIGAREIALSIMGQIIEVKNRYTRKR